MVEKIENREIVVTRVFNAPRELVFEAWTHPEHLVQWWGPKGFTLTVNQIDVRPGGVWSYIMHGPAGEDYVNKIEFLEVVSPERLFYSHGDDKEEHFQVTVAFSENGNNQTEITMRMVFKSTEDRDQAVKEFGAIEGANSTLDRLEELLAKI